MANNTSPKIWFNDSQWLNLILVALFLSLIACGLLPVVAFLLLSGNQCAVLERANLTVTAKAYTPDSTAPLIVFMLLLLVISVAAMTLYRQRSKLKIFPSDMSMTSEVPILWRGRSWHKLALVPAMLLSCSAVFCAGQLSLIRQPLTLCSAILPDGAASYDVWAQVQVVPIDARLQTLQASEQPDTFVSANFPTPVSVALVPTVAATDVQIVSDTGAALPPVDPPRDSASTDNATTENVTVSDQASVVSQATAISTTVATAQPASTVASRTSTPIIAPTSTSNPPVMNNVSATQGMGNSVVAPPISTSIPFVPTATNTNVPFVQLPTNIPITTPLPLTTDVTLVLQSVSNFTPIEGEDVSIIWRVTNMGPNTATNIVISAAIGDNGLGFVSSGVSQGSLSSDTWLVGTLASGASAMLLFTSDVSAGTAGTSITRTRSIQSMSEVDSRLDNNTDSFTLLVQGAVSTITPTATPIPGPTSTPMPAATNTLVPTTTSTLLPTATFTLLPTATDVPTNTLVPTATLTPLPTATNTPVPTATDTPLPTATDTPSNTPTSTSVPTATDTPLPTATFTPTNTLTNTPVLTATDTPLPTATDTPTNTATNTPVPTATDTLLPPATFTPTNTATITPVPTATDTPTNTPTPVGLRLVSSGCAGAGIARYRVDNSNPYDIPFTWLVYNSSTTGDDIAVASGSMFFVVPVSPAGQTMQILVGGFVVDIKAHGPC